MKRRTWKYLLAAICISAVGCAPQTPPPEGLATRPELREAPGKKALTELGDLEPQVEKPTNPTLDELPERVEKLLQAGKENLLREDYTEAVDILDRAVGFAPSDPRLRRALGLAYLGMGNIGKARSNLIEAARGAPDDLEVQLALGRLALVSGDAVEAITRLRTALKCSGAASENPHAAETLLLLGRLLQEREYLTAALQCFDRLSKWIEDHGSKYARRGALRDLLLRPEKLLAQRGGLLLALKRPDKSEKLLRRAFRLNRTDTDVSRELLEALIELQKYEQGEKLILDLISEPSQRGQLPRLVQMLCSSWGDKDLPVRLWRKCRRNDVDDDRLVATLARTARRNGAVSQAIEMLSYSVKKKPAGRPLWLQLFATCGVSGRAERLEGIAAEVFQDDPQALRSALAGAEALARGDVAKDFHERFAAAVDRRNYDGDSRLEAMMCALSGKVASRRGDHGVAEKYCNRAVDKSPDLQPAYECLLEAHLAADRCRDARRLGTMVEKRFGEDAHFARYLKGRAELACGSAGKAADILARAVEKKPEHLPSLLALAHSRWRAGDTAQAAETFTNAIKTNPDRIETYRQLFFLYKSLDAYDQAKKVAAARLRHRPGDIAGMCMLAEALVLTGELDKGKKLLRRLIRTVPDDSQVKLLDVWIRLAAVGGVPQKRQYGALKGRIEEILSLEPDNAFATEALAHLEGKSGRDAEAVEALGKLYRITRRRPDAARTYASALARVNRYKDAAGVLKRRLDDNPGDNTAREFMLSVLEELGQSRRAEKYVRQWSKQAEDKKTLYYRLRLLKIYENAEQYDRAQKMLDKIIADDGDEFKKEKIRYFGLAGKYEQAVEYAEKISDVMEDDMSARRYLIAALTDGERYEEAIGFLDEWLAEALAKDTPVAKKKAEFYTRMKILVLAEDDRIEDARRFAQVMIKKQPDSLGHRESIVFALTQNERSHEALEMLEGWLESPHFDQVASWCRTMIVSVLRMEGRYEQAVERARKYLPREAKNHRLLSVYSTCLSHLGRDKPALEALGKAYELRPDDISLNNNLGYMYADMGIRLRQAEQMIRKALGEQQKEVSFLDSLGWVLYKQGDFSSSARTFLKALRLLQNQAPRDEDAPVPPAGAVVHDHAGDVFWRLGWRNRAVRLWSRALEQAGQQEESDIREIRKILDNTPGKIDAARRGKEPPLAPLGEKSSTSNSGSGKSVPPAVK